MGLLTQHRTTALAAGALALLLLFSRSKTVGRLLITSHCVPWGAETESWTKACVGHALELTGAGILLGLAH